MLTISARQRDVSKFKAVLGRKQVVDGEKRNFNGFLGEG